jgi:hypothetical protein
VPTASHHTLSFGLGLNALGTALETAVRTRRHAVARRELRRFDGEMSSSVSSALDEPWEARENCSWRWAAGCSCARTNEATAGASPDGEKELKEELKEEARLVRAERDGVGS